MRNSRTTLVAAAASLLTWAVDVRGFGVETHRRMSVRAAEFCPRLTGALQLHAREFPNGLNQVLGGRTVPRLVGDGSADEDSPFWRPRHHFHDPTRNWDAAGLMWNGPDGMSSILWQQHASQGALGTGYFAWGDAREHYRRALTDGTKASRDQHWPRRSSRSDTSSISFKMPGHPPIRATTSTCPETTMLSTRGPTRPANRRSPASTREISSCSTRRPCWCRPIRSRRWPIARFIDATDGARPLPDWGTDVGIAEYSNGKFFSDDRLFEAYAHPAPVSLESCDLSCDPGTQVCTGYLCFRAGQGETDYKVVRASALTAYLMPGSDPAEPPLDNPVLDDYGRKLFPRAIGYSVGLIDYFFRTSAKADGSPALRLTATNLGASDGTLTIENRSGEYLGQGTFELFYDDRTTGLRQSAGSASGSISIGGSITIDADDGIEFQELRQNGPINGSVVVVYRGPIGLEADAIAERTCDCPARPKTTLDDPPSDCAGLCPANTSRWRKGLKWGIPASRATGRSCRRRSSSTKCPSSMRTGTSWASRPA